MSFGERQEQPFTDAGGQPVSSASAFALLAADGRPPALEPHRGHILRLTDSLGPEFGRAPQETPRLCSTGSGAAQEGRWVGRPLPAVGCDPSRQRLQTRWSPEGAPKGAGRRVELLQPRPPPSLGAEGSKTPPPTGPGEVLEETPSSSRRSLALGPTLWAPQQEGQSLECRGTLGTAVLPLRALADHRPFTLSDPPSPAAAGPAGWPGWTPADPVH